jgi:hypothetical protein
MQYLGGAGDKLSKPCTPHFAMKRAMHQTDSRRLKSSYPDQCRQTKRREKLVTGNQDRAFYRKEK